LQVLVDPDGDDLLSQPPLKLRAWRMQLGAESRAVPALLRCIRSQPSANALWSHNGSANVCPLANRALFNSRQSPHLQPLRCSDQRAALGRVLRV